MTDKRLNEIESSMKVIAQYVKEQSEKIERELNEIKTRKTGPDVEELKKRVDELLATPSKSKNVHELEIKLNERIGELEKQLGHVDAKSSEKASKSLDSLRTEFEDFRREISPRIHFVDGRMEKLNDAISELSGKMDTDEVKRRFDGMEKKLHEALVAKNHMDDVEKGLDEIKSAAKKIRDFDDMARKLDERIRHSEEIFVKESFALKNFSEELVKLKSSIAAQMNELNREFGKLGRYGSDDMKKIRDDIDKRVKEVEDRVSKIGNLELHDYKKLEDELSRITKTLSHENSIEKKLGQHDRSSKDTDDFKYFMENETAKRLSFEKRMHDMEASMNDMRKKFDGSRDIEEINNKIRDMEKNIKMASVKLHTQQLNEFAKSMDKKLPNIVSKEEYARQMADVSQRLKTIESPDLAPLGARVERLEHKLDDLASLLRGLHNRVPVVVE